MGNGNKMFHKKASHGGGSPKDTSDGKDLSKNAKNVISGTKLTQRPMAPNANALAAKGRK